MERLAERIMLLSGWRRAALAFGAGLLATLGLAPFNLSVVGFLSFPILVWLLDGASGEPGRSRLRRALPGFRIGWCFGFGYFLGGLWWLGAALLVDGTTFLWALPFAVLGLPMVLALYHGAACWLARLFWTEGPARLLALAASLALFEWLRGILLTGFPWNAIGVLAAPAPLLMQSVSVVGLNALTLAAVFVFSLPALVAGRRSGRLATLAFGALLVVLHVGFGAVRLAQAPAAGESVPDLALRIVQPAIRQGEKWDPAEAERNFSRLLELTRAPDGPDAPSAAKRLVIWPESAFPFILTDRPDAVGALAQTLQPGETLLAGATRVEEGAVPRFYNSIYVIGEDGTILDAADKLHLVPFGEYLPFQSTLEGLGIQQLAALPGGFSAGAQRSIVQAGADNPRFLPAICYEAIFPAELRRALGGTRPDFILNVTNDAWYGNTPGPFQHLRQAEITAVALGLPLVRAANTGVSEVADRFGRALAGLSLGSAGVVDTVLPAGGPPTFYAKLGESVFAAGEIASFVVVLAALGAERRRRRR